MSREQNLDDLIAGDTQEYDFTFTNDDGSAIDITGWTLWMTLKDSMSVVDSEAAVHEEVTTHDAPTQGKTSVTLDPSQTSSLDGKYQYDVQVERDGGSVYTVLRGTIYVRQGVTDS